MNIQWQTVKLDTVLKQYIDGCRLTNGDKILRADWFIDVSKNTVVFELIVEEPPDNRPG